MQYDPELFMAVKGILEKAHQTWGDFTASGAAYAILEEFEAWEEKRKSFDLRDKMRQAVMDAHSLPNACLRVRTVMREAGVSLPPLKQTKDYVESIRYFPLISNSIQN